MFASEDKASGAVNTSGSEVRAPDKKALIWRGVLVSQSRLETEKNDKMKVLTWPGNSRLAYDIINTIKNTAPRAIKRQRV